MDLAFYNNSKLDINIKIKDKQYSVLSKSNITVGELENPTNIEFLIAGNSYIHKMLGTVAGYRFYVASEYIISSENASDRITLNVIGVSGDHEEYYLRTVPVSDNASIKLKCYNIPDAEIIKKDVISNYQHEQDRKRELKKKDKKGSWIIDIILDIMYSALPVIFFVYLFAHNHVSKTTMLIIMAVVLVIVVLIAQLSGLFYDKVLKKPIDKVITNDSDKKEFDINSVFNENHIRYIVHDKERYQNKE